MKKNMKLSLIAKLVTLITGLIVQHQILISIGSTYNGLTSSISQVMSYLMLLEAGLGAASIQAFYKPLSEKNWKSISSIFAATDRSYKQVAFLFGGLLLATSLLLPLVVSGEVDYITAGLLTLVTGASSVLSYLVGGKYTAFLSADNKLYIGYILDIVVIILSCIFRVLALLNGCGIVIVQLINFVIVGSKNFACAYYVKKKYSDINYKAIPNMASISKRWNVLIHQIAGIVVNHTDITILTIFSSLKLVSVYSVYNMVFGQMSTFISSIFSQAPQATFGMLYAKNKDDFVEFYRIYENLFSIILFIITTIALILILPFVSIYTIGVNDIQYIDAYLPILFSLILLMNQIRTPSLLAIHASGTFKETQTGAIVEAIINITVSLILFFTTPLGLYGLLLGTVCSYIYRTIDVIRFVYKYVLKEKCYNLIRLLIINLLSTSFLYVIFCKLFPIQADNYFMWIIYAIAVSIATCILFISMNYIFNRQRMKETIKYVVTLLKKK